MRLIITGAGGFIGKRLIDHALIAGHEVHAYTGRNPVSIQHHSNLIVMPGDLNDPQQTFPDQFDFVIHAAASSPTLDSSPDFTADNDSATHRMAMLAVRAQCQAFIYLSSISVYGPVFTAKLDEDTPTTPSDPYGRTKLAGEAHLSAKGMTLPALALRLPGVVGRGAKRNWLAGVKGRSTSQRPESIYMPEAPFNNALHVDDLGTFLMEVLFDNHLRPGLDVLTLAADGVTTVREAVELVRPGVTILERSAAKSPFTISIEKAKRVYDFRPMDIRETLTKFAAT